MYLTDEMLVWVGEIGKPVRLPPVKVRCLVEHRAKTVVDQVCSARLERERHPARKRGESRLGSPLLTQILIPVFIINLYRTTRATKRRKKSESEEEVDEGSSEEDFESDLEKVPPQTEDEGMSEGERSGGEEKEEQLGRGARGRANVRVCVLCVVAGD